MKQRNLLLFLIIGIACTINIIGNSGCANIIPPSGGPKDTLPPVLLSAKPADSTRAFAGKKIVFVFNEYVQLDNVLENLLVNPVPSITPEVKSNLKTVTVTLKDTLERNTTYSLNFGNSIKDINEGNPLKNFTYIFTTGKSIDSLEVSGKVIDAETGRPDSTLIVVLHKNLADSAVATERPRFAERVKGDGSFIFHNLPPGTFAIYALHDEGGMKRYTSTFKQKFAFSDSLVVTQASPRPVTLYAFTAKDTTPPKPPPVSSSNVRKPAAPKGVTGATDKRLRFETTAQGGLLDLLGSFDLIFRPAPYKSFDSSKVHLTGNSFKPLTGYSFIKDTSNTKITLKYPWAENTPYNLILEKDFATDTAGHQLLKADTIAFRTKKESDYASVRLRLLNLDLSRNPVLEFIQGEQIKFSQALTTREFNAKLFVPGDYDLRILYDDNKNGKWDPGDFSKHLQPEKVQPIPRKLSVKANWNNEVDITL
jgi:uncharacterized protein (DUF2141 family)